MQAEYLPIPEFGQVVSMSRSAVYDALARGDLRAVRVGKRTLVDVEHARRWLASLPSVVITPRRQKASS